MTICIYSVLKFFYFMIYLENIFIFIYLCTIHKVSKHRNCIYILILEKKLNLAVCNIFYELAFIRAVLSLGTTLISTLIQQFSLQKFNIHNLFQICVTNILKIFVFQGSHTLILVQFDLVLPFILKILLKNLVKSVFFTVSFSQLLKVTLYSHYGLK